VIKHTQGEEAPISQKTTEDLNLKGLEQDGAETADLLAWPGEHGKFKP
jgi:hypothetical protein